MNMSNKVITNFVANSGESETEQSGNITQFSNDAMTIKAMISDKIDLDRQYKNNVDNETPSDIKDFFVRPLPLVSGNLSISDGATTFSNYRVMGDVLSKNIYKNKLSGYLGIRATLVLRLQVNANPFQQGRYILAFLPTGGATISQTWIDAHRHMATQITTLPHVELDVACDTEVQLRIPFVSSYLSFLYRNISTVNNAVGDPGIFFIYPYSPLAVSAGSTTASYTLWTSFDDIELFSVAVPQSGVIKDPVEKEQELAQVGPVTNALRKATKTANILGEIPLLGEFAKPVSWVTDVLSRAAHVWGWSKPSNQAPIHRMQRTVFPFNCNVDGVDNSMKLSMSTSNKVELLPGVSQTTVDEMGFDKIKKISAYWYRVNWDLTQPTGTGLMSVVVGPETWFKFNQSSILGTTYYNMPPVSWMSDFFAYWRGSFKLTIKIVKTKFHSGRLLFVYNPGPSQFGTSTTGSVEESSYIYKQIIDVREASVVTLDVPYKNIQPWSRVKGNKNSCGRISLVVIDPLVAPDTVKSSVTILFEICGGDDYQVCVPSAGNYNPTVWLANYQSGEIELQSGVINTNADECSIVEGTIGGASIDTPTDLKPHSTSVGEVTMSFRSLLKKFSALHVIDNSADVDSTLISPFSMPVREIVAIVVSNSRCRSDLYAKIGVNYAIHRGGVRLRIWWPYFSTNCTPVASLRVENSDSVESMQTLAGSSDTYSFVASELGIWNNFVLASSSATNGIEVEVPQYHDTHSRVSNAEIETSVSYPYAGNGVTSPIRVQVASGDVTGAVAPFSKLPYVARAFAEDASFSTFVSVVPCYSG